MNTNDNVQLTIDSVVYNLDEESLDTLQDSIDKRDKTIDELNMRLNMDIAEKTQKFKVGDESKEYKDMGTLYNDMQKVVDGCMAKYDKVTCDMKTMTADMKEMALEKDKKLDEASTEVKTLKEKVSELEGKNASLESELSKRLDAKLIDNRVNERVNLIDQVKELNLDSENLLEMTNREIKIDSIVKLNKGMNIDELSDKPDAYIDGAFEVNVSSCKERQDSFAERKEVIERTSKPKYKDIRQEVPQIDPDLQRRIKKLNGGH